MVAEHAFTAGGDDDYNDVITAKSIPSGKNFSVILNVDDASKVITSADTNGFIEVEINVYFDWTTNAESSDRYRVTMRLIEDGPDSMIAQHRLTKEGGGTLSERIPITTVDWHKPTTLSIEWKETEQKFTFSANTTTWDIHVSDFVNQSDAVEESAAVFSIADLENLSLSLITTVRNMNVAGESGYIKVNIDEVKVDGAVYDDFGDDVIDSAKWDRESVSF